MGAKRELTPLADADLVDEAARDRLKKLGVTTVEELVAELESQPEGVLKLLGLTERQLKRLQTDSHAALPEETRNAMERVRNLDFPLGGALDPDSED